MAEEDEKCKSAGRVTKDLKPRASFGKIGFWIICLCWLVVLVAGVLEIYVSRLPALPVCLSIGAGLAVWGAIVSCAIGLIVDDRRGKKYALVGLLLLAVVLAALSWRSIREGGGIGP